MLYQVYATKNDLASYLFVDVDTLGANEERMLQRASDLVTTAMFKNFISTNSDHLNAAKLATCAQVEMWMKDGEDKGISHNVKSYSLDSLSVSYDDGALSSQLSKRAMQYLSNVGLLYRGV